MANKDKEKKAGYLQSVALDFKVLGVGLELGTFGYRVQRSDHDQAAWVLICVATLRHAYCSSTNQCLQILTPEKKKIRILRPIAFQARVIKHASACFMEI